jgi:pimeloyl-ACP methyl ester carboxylesterase
MGDRPTHYVTTTDGITIGGTVHGEGPPLVFVHGAMADGDIDWQALLPYLTSRFTCHLPSFRGRGRSDDHPDLSPGRMVDDILTYVDSLEAPAGLVGWSIGAYLVVTAAATQSDAVDAVAPIEPGVLTLMDEQEQAVLGDAVARMGILAAGGNLAAAIRTYAGWPFNDGEIAMAENAGYFEAASRYVPNLLNLLRQWREYEGPTPEDPAVLAAIATPMLVLHGANTTPFLTASARHVAELVPNARVREIPGAGHAAPLTHPEALAETLIEFFAPTGTSA